MELEFVKAHGQGNDYIFFNFLDKKIPNINFNELSKKLSKRRFSIGSDGIVLILPDEQNDCFMRIFNADGSEATNCGTALRCVTAIVSKDVGLSNLKINTLSGVKKATVIDPERTLISVDMGEVEIIKDKLSYNGYHGHLVNVGNPHFVVFREQQEAELLAEQGSQLEYAFPEFGRVNIEFATVSSKDQIVIDIWERGSGTTLGCGTGATAAAFAGKQFYGLNQIVNVAMPGGNVYIEGQNNRQHLQGTVEIVYKGEISL